MKKIFNITGLVGFDLLRFSKDEFYNFIDQEYKKQFGKDIETLEAEIKLIKDGVKIKLMTFKGENENTHYFYNKR